MHMILVRGKNLDKIWIVTNLILINLDLKIHKYFYFKPFDYSVFHLVL